MAPLDIFERISRLENIEKLKLPASFFERRAGEDSFNGI